MSSEKFCLKWNDFEANISGAFRELRDDKDFFDVTLACDDDQINAHKVILSACSPFFKNILRRNPHQHPLLYMKGVSFSNLQSVLNFMYHGEVNVAQDELNNFLAVAEELRVKGLTQNQGGGSSSRNNTKPQSEPIKPKDVKRPVIPSRAPAAPVTVDDDIQEVVPVKSEPGASQSEYHDPGQSHQLQQFEGDMQYEEGYDDYGQYDDSAVVTPGAGQEVAAKGVRTSSTDNELDTYLRDNIIKLSGGGVQCKICDKITAHTGNMKQHFITHHSDAAPSTCPICGKTYKNKNSLNSHMSHHHRQFSFNV